MNKSAILVNPKDWAACLGFIFGPQERVGLLAPVKLIARFYEISLRVDSPHRQWEILRFVREILRHPAGSCFVEAGSFKGASAAKFSLAAALTGAKLYVFDSFEGIPDNAEPHEQSIFGQDLRRSFVRGTYAGSLEEVRGTIGKFGSIRHCEFVKGWFDDTMPGFHQPICGAYIDVDLASSTRTCIKHLYPLLGSGDCLMSQDGHVPLVIDVFRDKHFWRTELGLAEMPPMQGLGTSKLVVVTKA